MAATDLQSVQEQIQKWWSPLFSKQLREKQLLAGLVNKDYQGSIMRQGDRVNVSQINAPDGQLLTVGTNADSFETEEITTTSIEIVANKRAVAAYEVQDLVDLQSQLDSQESTLRDSLMFAVNKQINNYLYSLVSPSASAPDHVIGSVTDMNAAQVASIRTLAAQAKWMEEKGWWLLADPVYYSDILDDLTLASSDFGAVDAPIIGGKVARQRFGFNILEDNSEGIRQLSPTQAAADTAIAFHPDFMHLVMQQEAQFKVSELHSQKKFGYVVSVDLVFGAKQGIDGDKKCIKIYNT